MHGGDFHGPDGIFDVELAFTGTGEFTGIRIAVIDDEGAYSVIDAETGAIELDRYYLAHDCGTVINPDVVRGMVYGGTAHGIGVALYEQFAFSDEGQPLTQSFMDYLLAKHARGA